MSKLFERGIHALYEDDPERADYLVFGRVSGPNRRGFLKSAGLAAMGTLVGAKIPFSANYPAGLIPAAALVYDLVYNPTETPLLAAARCAGARTLGGLPMLVYQGAAAFRMWTGREAPVDVMMRAASAALQRG